MKNGSSVQNGIDLCARMKGTAVLEGSADPFVYDLLFNAIFTAMHGIEKIVFLDKLFTVGLIGNVICEHDSDFRK